jgi:hypothetical protein
MTVLSIHPERLSYTDPEVHGRKTGDADESENQPQAAHRMTTLRLYGFLHANSSLGH